MKIKNLFSGILLSISFLGAQAQEDYRKLFPEAEAVYTNLAREMTIKREDGKLVAYSNVSEDLVYLNDKSVKMMNRGYIYHSSFNKLESWNAYTQLPDEKKKLKTSNASTSSSRQDYIFYDDVKLTSFDFAGSVVGATRHLEYQLKHTNILLLNPCYFERRFPVVNGEFQVTFPSDIKVKYILKGLNADKISFSESRKKDKTTYTFRVSNLPGEVSYPDAPDNAYYATHVIFYVEQVKEGDQWVNFLSNTDDLYRHNYEFIRNTNDTVTPEVKALTDSLTRGITDDRMKAKKIYKWVQEHIKYVAFEEGMEGFVPREAGLVCTRRYGDCKDMASILYSMLNYAGVKAYFTWIGTRDIPYDYTEVHLPITDNHMICTIKLGEEYIFLDGTDNGCIFGMPSSGIQGKQAMVSINEKEYKIIRVPVVPAEKNLYIDSTLMELTDKGIVGKVNIYMNGYNASRLHSTLGYRNQKETEEYFSNRFSRASNKIKFSNWKVVEGEEDVRITADFELPDYAKKLADEWFLNLNLFKLFEHEEIDYPKRKIPISYNYLGNSTYITGIKIPAGYKVAYLPKSDSYKNSTWGFIMNYSTKNDTVFLTQEFDNNQLLLQPSGFEAWNKVLEHLFPNYKQTVSFSKK